MKLKVLFVAILMVMTARVTAGKSYPPAEYDVKTIEDHARVRSFTYESYEQCYADVQDQARNEMLPPDQEDALLSSVPKGGVLFLELLGNEWRMANGPNWTYIITDEAGKELFRSKGSFYSEPAPAYEMQKTVVHTRFITFANRQVAQVAPERDAFGRPVYIMRDQKSIAVPLPDTFKLYIVDSINKNRCSYLLTRGANK